MLPPLFRAALSATCLALLASVSPAQDLRVTTSLMDRSQPDHPRVLSSSLTLFHAGQVYDYMVDVGEVVIYEPQANRFVVLNKNLAATEVSFAEVTRFLDVARNQLQSYLTQLQQESSPAAVQQAHFVRFQFQPQFRPEYDESTGVLKLVGDPLTYQVRTDKSPAPDAVKRYLDYADWTSRLNYVLHPNAMYPSPRLMLNSALREKDRLPTQVELTLADKQPVKLQADHSYEWTLRPADRNLLSHWEAQLKAKNIRWMTFQKYQEEILNVKSDKTARR